MACGVLRHADPCCGCRPSTLPPPRTCHDEPLPRPRRPLRGLRRLAPPALGRDFVAPRLAPAAGPRRRPDRRQGPAPARAAAGGQARRRVRRRFRAAVQNGVPLGGLLALALGAWFIMKALRVTTAQGCLLLLGIGTLGLHAMLEFPQEYAYFLLPAGLMMGALDQMLPPSRA